jgi:putative FmdB family regulatory protein
MPIYAYKCGSCGHAKDVLRKISDPPLTVCPACNAESFSKQITAAGFQLKGSGWYVTDFRGGSSTAAPATPADQAADKPAEKSADKPPEKSAEKSADKPADSGSKSESAPAKSSGAPSAAV